MGRSLVPPKNPSANDLIQTPFELARQIVNHFEFHIDRSQLVMDPCRGTGAFYEAMLAHHLKAVWDEITDERDFFTDQIQVGWIISNPPYSQLLKFLDHSFELADNVVYLIQPPAAFFTAKLNLAEDYSMGIREIYRVSLPAQWKAQGLAFGAGLGAVWWQRDYLGDIKIVDGRT